MLQDPTVLKLNWMQRTARPIKHGDLPDLYLKSRGLRLKAFPNDLRQDRDGNMVAFIRDSAGEIVSYQRTFFRDFQNKERRFAGGCSIPPGSAIRLYAQALGSKLMGVAESVENALTCSRLFQIPCWSLLSAQKMARWLPPSGVERVLIFADDDRNLVGQKYAETLANELGARGIKASVRLPPMEREGWDARSADWNDFLLEHVR